MASPAKQESLRTSWSVRSKSPRGSPRTTAAPASPVHLSRSFGADSFQAELLRSKSLAVPLVNDFKTECLGTVAECDVRCALAVGPEVWVGLRDGSIAIRTAEKLETVVEPRKGVVVWSLLEVGATVWAGCSDGFIRVYAQGSHKLEKQFARHGGGGGGVHALVLHAPSHTVFSASNDFEILAWDSRSGDFIRQLAGHSSAVRALVLDAITLYSGGDDGKVILWDIATFEQIAEFTGHTKGVHALTLTSQNTLWSGSEDGTIRIWDLTKRAALSDALTQTGSVEALLSVGDRVWSGSGDTVYIWDAASYQLLGTFVAHTGYVNTIVVVNRVSHFQIWTAGTDQIKLWRSEFSPDESSVLVRKLARCSVTEFDHHRVAGQLARGQAELADVTARLRAAEEELGRLHWLNEENARLRAAAAESDRRRDEAERKAAALEAQQLSSDRIIAELRQDNRRLTDELAAAVAKAAELSQELVQQQRLANLQIDALRNKVEDLTSLTNVLKEEIRQHRADNADLTARLAKAEAERDEVLAKLKDLDSLFKSRLSLITAVYQTYQRLDATEKRIRSNPQTARDEVQSVLAEFRNVIAKHYTGDELVHLGTSRHFFPL